MLPMPFSPAWSWPFFTSRLKSLFDGADPRVCAAFWLFGLINNVLYVIILSAALDLVGPSVPKGVVLLADVIPSFVVKLTAPYFVHLIPYSTRVCSLVIISTLGMLLIALSPVSHDAGSIAIKLVGIMMASLSSGGGETNFLGLTHYYGHFSLASWGSGTGGAGLIGAGAYVVATTIVGLSVRTSLLTFSFLPLIMLGSYFLILPREPLKIVDANRGRYERLPEDDEETSRSMSDSRQFDRVRHSNALSVFKANLARIQKLIVPYMIPLLLVYIAEYTINQGVAPTLLFPLTSSPFREYRSFYPTYSAIYQLGVFISRSSTPFFRIHRLYTPSILQVVNLVILTLHALFDFLPNIWFVFAIIFWEGLLGGLVYVSTFAEIIDHVPSEDREFSLGAVTVSDSGGICIAGFLGMAFEVWLCRYQVSHGRNYCKLT